MIHRAQCHMVLVAAKHLSVIFRKWKLPERFAVAFITIKPNRKGAEVMKVYAVRHGEIELNAENRVCGVSNGELTERGREQAERLAEELSGISFDAVISSPQKRALQTARPTAERCGLPVLQEPRLAEQNYGIYEGVPRDDEGFLSNKRQFAFRYPGGESMMQVAARVYGFLDELKEKRPQDTVLLVTHGGVLRVLNSYFEDMTNEEFFRFGAQNCEWKCYEC